MTHRSGQPCEHGYIYIYIYIYIPPKISNRFVHVWDITHVLKLQRLVKTYTLQIKFLATPLVTLSLLEVILTSAIRKLGCGFLFVFYSRLTMALSFARYSELLVENREIFIPHAPAFSAPPLQGRDPVGISRRCLTLIKLE